jgi:hypothetical protein
MSSPSLAKLRLDLEKIYCVENYQVQELSLPEHLQFYDQLVLQTYESLGFLCEKILPRPHTKRYGIMLQDEMIGICSLTPIVENDNIFTNIIPEFCGKQLVQGQD